MMLSSLTLPRRTDSGVSHNRPDLAGDPDTVARAFAQRPRIEPRR